ncbi:TPA: RNA polymerase sigma factor [Streptococcus suis]
MEFLKLDAYEKELIGFAKEIIAYLVKSGIPPEQAEDVVQDVFVTLLEMPVAISAEKMRAWMYRVSINRYIDKYRREKQYRKLLQKELLPRYLQPTVADYDFLLEELENLPEEDALVLDLFYGQGFSLEEIAELLSWSLSKVKIRMYRSRHKLRKQLSKKGYHHGDI